MNKKITNAFKAVMEARNRGSKFFEVVISENSYTHIEYISTPLEPDLDGSEYEYIYSLFEIEDAITKLFCGQNMYFQPNRDDDKTKGIITRIL